MADNYLGRKMEEYFARPAAKAVHKAAGGLARLVSRNRSHRSYDPCFEVRDDQLRRMLSLMNRIPSARNAQVLRYRVVRGRESDILLPLLRMGGALPELQLPRPESAPRTFIVICSTVEETRYVDIDLGIAVQTLLLQAVEMGLNGICVAAFDAVEVQKALSLPLRPLLVVALGRGADRIEVREIRAGEPTSYYREEGVHCVPKIAVEDLVIPPSREMTDPKNE